MTRLSVVFLFVVSAGCSSSMPSSPTAPTPTQAQPTPAPPSDSPALSGPSRTFVFAHELSLPVMDYTRHSQIVLYDDGACVLQYANQTGGGYRGSWVAVANGLVYFRFDGFGVPGTWSATANLAGDSLTIRYGSDMIYSDFEDAAYVKTQ